MEKGSKLLKVEISMRNRTIEQRTRILFETNNPSKKSIADQLFGTIRRDTFLKESIGWREKGWEWKA